MPDKTKHTFDVVTDPEENVYILWDITCDRCGTTFQASSKDLVHVCPSCGKVFSNSTD